jgi:hypothetical protein
MLIHSAVITGSVQFNNTDVSGITNVAGFATTASLNTLIVRTGSYATTGSNQFNGNQSISGSITSNGTITAQTLVVQTVTSSIEFVTGSTRNGSLAENTHQFTGSMSVSGTLSATDFIRGTCTTSYNGDGIRVYATATGAAGSQPGIGFWTAAGSKRFITQLDVSTDTWMVVGSTGTAYMTVNQSGSVGIGNTSPSTKLHVTGVITANELILAGGGSWSYTTDSNWSSHQLIIPSGTLSGGGVYLIRIQYGSGNAPYIVYATGIWQPVQSNGGSADTEVLLTTSSHQGVGTGIYIRNQSVGGQASSALYARLSNFPSTVGSLTATATRLM